MTGCRQGPRQPHSPVESDNGVPAASLTAKGTVQLSSATDSQSETEAATPKAVKIAYDLARENTQPRCNNDP